MIRFFYEKFPRKKDRFIAKIRARFRRHSFPGKMKLMQQMHDLAR